MKTRTATFLLFLTALIWGTSFVAQDVSSDFLEPNTFNFIRFYIGALVLLPVILITRRGKSAKEKKGVKSSIIGGLCCGIMLFLASYLQQAGVHDAGAGKAGFITSLYNIFVPFILIVTGKKVPKKIWFCALFAIMGTYLLCMGGSQERLSISDIQLFLCALFFAFHIITIDHFRRGDNDPLIMSAFQFFTAGVLSMAGALIFETISPENLRLSIGPILYSGIFSIGVAYTLQMVSQQSVPPTIATLILSLESVISVISGWIILSDAMTAFQLIGCVIVFAAVVFAQLPQKTKLT